MKQLGKCIFYASSLLLWIFLAAGVVELWARWQYQRIERENPFVLSRTQEQSWPMPDVDSDGFSPWLMDAALREHYLGGGKTAETLPPLSAQREMEHRLPFFRSYSDFEIQVAANVLDMNILLVDAKGQVEPTRSAPPNGPNHWRDWMPEEDAPPLIPAMDLLRNEPDPNTHLFVPSIVAQSTHGFGYCLTKADADRLWLLFRKTTPSIALPEDSLWDAPFFSYRKQVRRTDHVNVLGLKEDFYVNNAGFRDADILLPKPEGVYRILCIGASTTEEGPTNALTYPALLEAKLNKHFQSKRFDVINCGVSGMNSLKHRIKTPEYLGLEPDMLILYVAVNDLCHDMFPILVKERSAMVQWLQHSWFINRYLNVPLMLSDPEMLRQLIRENKMPDLRYLIQRAKEKGIRVALCSFAAPTPKDQEQWDYYEYYTRLEWGGVYIGFSTYLQALDMYNAALRELAAAENALYIDVRQQLRGGAEYFGDICHLRNAGIERKADIIATELTPWLARKTTGDNPS